MQRSNLSAVIHADSGASVPRAHPVRISGSPPVGIDAVTTRVVSLPCSALQPHAAWPESPINVAKVPGKTAEMAALARFTRPLAKIVLLRYLSGAEESEIADLHGRQK